MESRAWALAVGLSISAIGVSAAAQPNAGPDNDAEKAEHADFEKQALGPIPMFLRNALNANPSFKFSDLRPRDSAGKPSNSPQVKLEEPNVNMDRRTKEFRTAPKTSAAEWRRHFDGMLAPGETLQGVRFSKAENPWPFWIHSDRPSPFWARGQEVQPAVRVIAKFTLITSKGLREASEVCDAVFGPYNEKRDNKRVVGLLLRASLVAEPGRSARLKTSGAPSSLALLRPGYLRR